MFGLRSRTCMLRQAKSNVWPQRHVPTLLSRRMTHRHDKTVLAARWHGGHSHGPNPLLSHAHSPEAKAAQKVTLLGLYTNVGLSALKGGVGYSTGSMSLVADALHSLTDVLSDFITLGAVRISRRPATNSFPHGFGRIETIGAMSVAAFLLSTSVGISYSAVQQILQGTAGFMDGGATWATGAAAVSLVSKEAIFRVTKKVANDQNSPVLYANAWHHRSDALSSLVALVGVGGSWLGFPLCDPIGGLIVGGMVGKIGWEVATNSLTEMMDKSLPVPPVLTADVKQQLQDSAFCLQRVDCHKIGPYYYVKVSVAPARDMSVDDLLSVRSTVRDKVMHSNTDMDVRFFDFCIVGSDETGP